MCSCFDALRTPLVRFRNTNLCDVAHDFASNMPVVTFVLFVEFDDWFHFTHFLPPPPFSVRFDLIDEWTSFVARVLLRFKPLFLLLCRQSVSLQMSSSFWLTVSLLSGLEGIWLAKIFSFELIKKQMPLLWIENFFLFQLTFYAKNVHFCINLIFLLFLQANHTTMWYWVSLLFFFCVNVVFALTFGISRTCQLFLLGVCSTSDTHIQTQFRLSSAS